MIKPALASLGRLYWAGLAAAGCMAAGSAALGKALTKSSETRFDKRVRKGFEAVRTPQLDRLAVGVSWVSDVPQSVCAAGLSVLALRRAAPEDRVRCAAAMGLSATIHLVSQVVANRERPRGDKLGRTQLTSSFPSGHVGAAVALAVAGWSIVGRKHRLARTAIAAYPLVVAWSRLYSRQHHATDVLAGIANGFVAGWVVRKR